jgi:hypothetical protein
MTVPKQIAPPSEEERWIYGLGLTPMAMSAQEIDWASIQPIQKPNVKN